MVSVRHEVTVPCRARRSASASILEHSSSAWQANLPRFNPLSSPSRSSKLERTNSSNLIPYVHVVTPPMLTTTPAIHHCSRPVSHAGGMVGLYPAFSDLILGWGGRFDSQAHSDSKRWARKYSQRGTNPASNSNTAGLDHSAGGSMLKADSSVKLGSERRLC